MQGNDQGVGPDQKKQHLAASTGTASRLVLRPYELIRQIHPHPSGRQTDAFFLVHFHPRVVLFEQRRIHSLRFCVVNMLLRLVHL